MIWVKFKEFYEMDTMKVPDFLVRRSIPTFSWISNNKLHWIVDISTIDWKLERFYIGDGDFYDDLDMVFNNGSDKKDLNVAHFVFDKNKNVKVFTYDLEGELIENSIDYEIYVDELDRFANSSKNLPFAEFFLYVKFETAEQADEEMSKLKLISKERSRNTYLEIPIVLFFDDEEIEQTYFFSKITDWVISVFPYETGILVLPAEIMNRFSVVLDKELSNPEIKIEVKNVDGDRWMYQYKDKGEFYLFRNGKNIRNLLKLKKVDITEEFNSIFSWEQFFDSFVEVDMQVKDINWKPLTFNVENIQEDALITFEKMEIDTVPQKYEYKGLKIEED